MSNSVVLERLPASITTSGKVAGDTVERRRIYIFLSRYGLIFGINLLVMLVGAVNYTNSLAYSLTFLLAALFLTGMLHTYSNLRGLLISAQPAEPVFAGQTAVFPLYFDNRSGRQRLALELHSRQRKKSWWRTVNIYSNKSSLDIAAASRERHNLSIPAPVRGYLLPGRIRISSSWPLGLFRAWSYMDVRESCLVYPKPAGSKLLPEMTFVEEDTQSGKGSGTEDFVGFRQYRSGDSMRSVDWKAYARERGLLSKRFSGKGTRKCLLSWQQVAHLGDTEARLSQLCRWILEAERLQVRYALQLPRTSVAHFANGESHKKLCLQLLATYGLQREQT